MALQVYLMRHGETEANVQQVLLGRGDSPFTDAGRGQPAEVAGQLRNRGLTHIYTSPMTRTRRTADLVLETLGRAIPLSTEPAIAEIDAGDYTGLPFAEVRRRVPTTAVLGEFRYPGGESWRDVQDRALRFVLSLEARHNQDAVLLVTHAGVIASLVAAFVAEPIQRYIRIRFGHDFLGRLTVASRAIVAYEKLAGTVDTWF